MPKMPGGRDNPAARFAGSGRPANPLKTMSRLLKYYGKCRWMFTVAVIMIAVYSPCNNCRKLHDETPLLPCWKRQASRPMRHRQNTLPCLSAWRGCMCSVFSPTIV